ncbi:steroid 21-hydroxylase isoform X3 [Lates calcarifer]|uniref:Steroid 21-hydroxylase n=1 Tax=Lates calcarifer TaxID=8187 RepID=A0AAJ7V4Q3_LATCA|nr:steroid 21-hydroxylase isoform X3 [Lates calcarifer]
MAIEISVISVGAVFLVVLLLMVLSCFSDRRDKSVQGDPKGTQSGLLHCLYQYLSRSPSPSLPGPPSRFLIGNMMELTHDHLPIHLTNLAQRYGNIYRLNCGNTTMVVLNSGEVIREALVKKWSDFAGRPISYTGDIVSGGGRSISLGDYNEEWRAHRRLVHSALQRCCQKSLHDVIERQALHLRKVLMDYKDRAVDLSEDFTVAASNVITTLAFGKEYDKSSSELQQLHCCLNEIVALWGSSWISALDSFPLLRKLPNPVFSRLLREVARRDEIIKKHLNNYKSQDKKNEDAITGSLLQGLDKHHNTEDGVLLTDTHVHLATVDLLIGGTETTAAWLNWTVAFLLHRPEVQTRVHEELCTVLEGRYPKYSDRHRLPVLCSLINEVLRLRPVAPLAVPHRAIRDSRSVLQVTSSPRTQSSFLIFLVLTMTLQFGLTHTALNQSAFWRGEEAPLVPWSLSEGGLGSAWGSQLQKWSSFCSLPTC